jgi:large subunit ribosomal protein L4
MENKLFLENIESQKKKKAIGLIHRVYLSQLINSRKYLASTKTKSEVRGGGRKPWRQKGTGRARAGSLRSPLFVGGGVIFGPKPRLVTRKINKKERRLAVLSAVSLKKNQIQLVEENTLTNFWLSSKNLKNVEVTTAACLNLKQLLNAKHIVLSEQSLDLINLTFGKQYE